MGGGSAPLTVEDSVQGITQILLTAAQVQFKVSEVPVYHSKMEITLVMLVVVNCFSYLLFSFSFHLQSKDVATPAAYRTFEDKLKNNNIVFAAFDGGLLPW